MFKSILRELKAHSPYTLSGAFSGIVILLIFKDISFATSYRLFYIMHPLHVFLSALVTTALYKIYQCRKNQKCNLFHLFLVGYFGSVGIATLSDSLIPFIGEKLLQLPHAEMHLGFIEEWWLVNPLALLGILAGYYRPSTKFPHLGHVLLSTWASLFHILMALGDLRSFYILSVVLLFLFLSVWLPCCLSDIVFPLLFVREKQRQ